MYLLFHKDKFHGVLKNKKTDTFLTFMLKKMGWKKEDVKVYGFNDSDEEKVEDFLRHMDNEDKCCDLKVDKNGLVEKIVYETYTNMHRPILPSEPDALEYYTQQEIDDYLENGAVGKKYFEDLKTWQEGGEQGPPPELKFPKKSPKFKFVSYMENMPYKTLDQLQGQLIDMDMRLAAEDTAIKKINEIKNKTRRENVFDKLKKQSGA